MATVTSRRIDALLLQDAIATLYTAVEPLQALASVWVANGLDADLPAEGEVKAVLQAYLAIEKPPLSVRPAITDVLNSTEEFDGIFGLPSGTSLYPFEFSGPLWSPLDASQGFGVPVTLQRVVIFAASTGTVGSDLSFDVRIDGTSIFSVLPTIPVGSGDNINLIVPDSSFVTKLVPGTSVLSAHIVSAPDDAESVTINIWLKP